MVIVKLGGFDVGGIFKPQFSDTDFSHLNFADFAGYCHRETIRNPNILWDFEMGNLPLTKFLNRLQRQGLTFFELNPGHDGFAIFSIGNTNHLHVADVGVRIEKLLYFTRIDVLSASDNHVFDAASGLIREIRAYYAAPAARDTATMPVVEETHIGELVDFDYRGRGYHLRWE